MSKHAWFFNWLWVIVWMAVIFLLSNTPDLRSGLDSTWDTLLRKAAHIAEYAVLAWLVVRAMGSGKKLAVLAAILVCLAYAASDEWHQTFVVGRHGAPIDVAVDSIGIMVGVGLYRRKN